VIVEKGLWDFIHLGVGDCDAKEGVGDVALGLKTLVVGVNVGVISSGLSSYIL
jgi:hypothetical protein